MKCRRVSVLHFLIQSDALSCFIVPSLKDVQGEEWMGNHKNFLNLKGINLLISTWKQLCTACRSHSLSCRDISADHSSCTVNNRKTLWWKLQICHDIMVSSQSNGAELWPSRHSQLTISFLLSFLKLVFNIHPHVLKANCRKVWRGRNCEDIKFEVSSCYSREFILE